MKIINGLVYHDGTFEKNKTIYTSNGYFSTGSAEDGVLDAEGGYVIPGLIDIHFHGCAGVDFCDGTMEALETLASYELSQGITTIHPATMTLSEEALVKIGKVAAEFYRKQQNYPECLKDYAELAGIYMEGPFVSREKQGAQNPAFIKKPDAKLFHRLNDAAEGLYRICVVAPEEEGASAFIREVKNDVRVSLAHTMADYDTANTAFQDGAAQVTHLYNAMQPFTHRAPGVIGAAFDNKHVMAELICDGIHIHPAVIRATFAMLGKERMILISDSMMATGMPDGTYALGGQKVIVKGKRAVLAEGGAIAGSASNLFECMRYAVREAGIPLEDVVQCATENPAKAIGIFDSHGSIEKGKYADFIVMDRDLRIKYVVKRGIICKKQEA